MIFCSSYLPRYIGLTKFILILNPLFALINQLVIDKKLVKNLANRKIMEIIKPAWPFIFLSFGLILKDDGHLQ